MEEFGEHGRISEETRFGANALRYTIAMSKDADSIVGEFDNNEITVFIPEPAARDWTTNDNVGFEIEQEMGDGTLTIIVEKDFVCIDRPNDPDRDDAYPNPNVMC